MNRESGRSTLFRVGFSDPERARVHLAELGEAASPLMAMLASAADPDLALVSLVTLIDLAEDRADLLAALVDDEGFAMRLLMVLGASQALGTHLHRHPEQWHELTDPDLGSTRPAAFAV